MMKTKALDAATLSRLAFVAEHVTYGVGVTLAGVIADGKRVAAGDRVLHIMHYRKTNAVGPGVVCLRDYAMAVVEAVTDPVAFDANYLRA